MENSEHVTSARSVTPAAAVTPSANVTDASRVSASDTSSASAGDVYTLPEDHPQVLGAKAEPLHKSAWARGPQTTPEQRAESARSR